MRKAVNPRPFAISTAVERAARIVRRVIGVPDYDGYLRHRAEKHPGEPAMSREEFVRDRQNARYERPGGRCC